MPNNNIVAWVEEFSPQINKSLEVIVEDIDNNQIKVPTYVYFTVGIRGVDIRLGVDTGSARTLLSEECFRTLNPDNQYKLQISGTSFEAVNGSAIECLGYVRLPVIFYGIRKNYKAMIKFFIIRNLGLQGLFGLDEISRHKFSINPAEQKCHQAKIGQVIIEVAYREGRGIRAVTITEDVTLPPLTCCDIKVNIPDIDLEDIDLEGVIQPRNDIHKLGLRACRVLTIARPNVITRVMNLSDQSLVLYRGENFGQFKYTSGDPILISTVLEQYGQCQLRNEEMEDHMMYEDLGNDNLDEVDFGLAETQLTDPEKKEVKNLLKRYREVFQWDNCPVSFTHKIKHRISLKPGAQPVKHKSRKFADDQNDFIEKEVQKLINQKIVRPSKSNWSARIVLSREERKGRWRLCVDYRAVNSLTVAPLAHPIPNIEEILQQFNNQKYFHTLDLFQGYHQVELEEGSKHITAFATRKGLFEFVRMPFGIAGCPASYQALMEDILGELSWKIAFVYIDDLIVFGKTYEEARDRLQSVLTKLKEAGLKLRASKCRLFQPSVEFLGFVVGNQGIKTCSHIVEAVLNFPKPQSVKEVQKFLGITNFYRTFIKSHSSILSPLINLTRKGIPFNWTTECQEAVDIMKTKLTTAPVRCYFDPELPTVLTTDASGRGIGCTLSQINKEGKMNLIAFGSRVLKPAERAWSTTEKECFAISFFVKKFRHFLSRPFLVFSDHNSLRYLSSMRDSSNKIARWLNFLSQYNFEVHHKRGDSRELVVPDILSRIMVGVQEDKEEIRALKMERPVLRLNKGEMSPIMMYWFCVEPAREDDFDEENKYIGAQGEEEPRERKPRLRIMLKNLQREVDKEREREGSGVV